MSRTYRKVIKQGVCYGSNTEFYRDMNRKIRNKNKHSLRNLIANNDIDTVNDLVMTDKPIHDSWNEPTDGTRLITKSDIGSYIKDNRYIAKHDGTSENFWNRKYGKYLKPKNRKHYRVI